jgi:hypothetical protein
LGDSRSSQVVHTLGFARCKRREVKIGGDQEKGSNVHKKISRFTVKKLTSGGVKNPCGLPVECLSEADLSSGVLKQTATMKVTTAPNAMRQGNSMRGSQVGAQSTG